MKVRTYESEIINNLDKKNKNKIDMPLIIAIIFKCLLFEKIPRKNENGRCLECDAQNLCVLRPYGNKIIFNCRCKFEQQYEIRKCFKWLIPKAKVEI